MTLDPLHDIHATLTTKVTHDPLFEICHVSDGHSGAMIER